MFNSSILRTIFAGFNDFIDNQATILICTQIHFKQILNMLALFGMNLFWYDLNKLLFSKKNIHL